MADSEVCQKWDAFLKSLSAWKIFRLTALDGFEAGMRAGEIARWERTKHETIVQLIFEEMLERDWSLSDIALRMGGKTPKEIGVDQLALHMYLCVHNEGVMLGEESARKLSKAFGLSEQFFVNMERAQPQPLPAAPEEKEPLKGGTP